jgi:outer membrane protein assembly factor BamB
MPRFLFALLTVACSTIPGLSARAQGTSLPTRRMLAPHGLERMWWNQATIDPSRDRVRYLVADENVVIVQSRSGIVTTFDIANGRKLWAVQVARVDAVAFPAITNDDLVLIVSGTSMYALQKFTGKLAWKFTLPSSPSTGPGIDGERVYVGARDGSMYAFNLRRIKKYFNERLLPQFSLQTMDWRYKAFKEVTTPPISNGRVVNFASRGGSLYSVTTTDHKLSFQFETDFPISAPMAESRRYLFLPSEDFKLYCLNKVNGVTHWVYNAGLEIRQKPQVMEQDVFLTPAHGGLHVVDRGSGNRKWFRGRITGFVAASPSRVYVSDNVGNLVILGREEGKLIAALPLRRFSVRLSNGRTDRIIIATERGLVACIRERGREFPIYHMYPERRPLLPEFAPAPPKAGIQGTP